MNKLETAALSGWIVQTKSVGRHLHVERAGMPGLIHITEDADLLRIGFFRENHESLAASLEVGYLDLRRKPRLLVVPAESLDGIELQLAQPCEVESAELGDWQVRANQILVDDYRRYCLEIRHLGRPGMIHLGADTESVSVEVWNHGIEQVVDAACVSFNDLRRIGRVG